MTVHSSVRGTVLAFLASAALLALGVAAIVSGGPHIVPVLLVVAGVGAAAVALLDLPRRAEFDREGITRVCWLRRQHLPWHRLVAIERTRPTTASVVANSLDRRDGVPMRVSGGLVARGAKRRRWLLTDQVESQAEHDRIVRLLQSVASPVAMRAARPHPGAVPTDLYRRSR